MSTAEEIRGSLERSLMAAAEAAPGRQHLGYVVVTYNQASGQPDDLASGDVLYDDLSEARECRDYEQERTRRHGRSDRHVVAEVIEMKEGNRGG